MTDFVQQAVLIVDRLTGNRTTLSGCANDACSSIVGSGRTFVGPLSLMQNTSGDLFIIDREADFFDPDPTGDRIGRAAGLLEVRREREVDQPRL